MATTTPWSEEEMMGKKNTSNLNWPGLNPSHYLLYVDSADKSGKDPSTWGNHLKLLNFLKFKLAFLSWHLFTSFSPEALCT